jgi:plasmid stabilization system protein ParE
MKQRFDIQIEQEALVELEDAYIWYENQSAGLGDRFKSEVDRAFNDILDAPRGYKKCGKHRQFPMKTFPFVILFEITKTTMYIDAVFHTSQDPQKKKR